ncbi:MAG: NAD(P)/FAD-dependent oxidoreductase [Chlamydiales bacterium]
MKGKILIIGAGLGGLALAQGLLKSGFDVTVFERDEGPMSRPQGYRISIRTLGLNALQALLSPEKVSRLSETKVSDVGDGFTLANEKMEPFFTVTQGQDAAVQFLRSELRSLLQEGINIEWGKRLINLEDKGKYVAAHFEDGSKINGDFLVGCDGSTSTVRRLLTSTYHSGVGSVPEIVDSHRAILGGQIDRDPEWNTLLSLNKTGLVRFLGPNSYYMGVCFSERADRSPTVFWAFSEEIKDHNAPWYQFDNGMECRKRILDHCKELMENESWHESLKKLVFNTPVEAIMAPWLVRSTQFPKDEQFPIAPTGRMTLLGDSAHAMPTEKGLGGNNVLEDARLLSSLLASSISPIEWPKLTEKFEREMYTRARAAVQESENAARYFQSLRPDS